MPCQKVRKDFRSVISSTVVGSSSVSVDGFVKTSSVLSPSKFGNSVSDIQLKSQYWFPVQLKCTVGSKCLVLPKSVF